MEIQMSAKKVRLMTTARALVKVPFWPATVRQMSWRSSPGKNKRLDSRAAEIEPGVTKHDQGIAEQIVLPNRIQSTLFWRTPQ